ncbi:ribosomal protein S18-alanine N-acetyltransferase [Microterricola viridarii]|uniref:ribosomal protein S18-alanine N-acetyltransferase n=1 Tax=Microterricola viridarii TaxID=412690 RepID=UPI000AB93A2F|nr:ribosomal protein S18-alanine N-acetyltransferase [Microterricola viridarii]
MTWQLRRAGPADVPAIMAIENAMFPTDAWSTDAMARDVADPHCYYLVAFPPDAPESIEAYAGLLSPRGAPEADIQTIAVTTAAQGRGLGRVLMLRLIDEARARGAREVFLEVRADNPGAIHLYTSLGFEELGVRRGYYKPDNVDAIVMRLAIPAPQAGLAGTTDHTGTTDNTGTTDPTPLETHS